MIPRPIALFLILCSSLSWAASESDLRVRLQNEFLPFYHSGENIYFEGVDGVHVNAQIFTNPNEKGAVVISPGRTESSIKYAELIHEFFQRGYSVYIIDHRGQGFSERMIGALDVGYVSDFDDYVDDFVHFVQTFVRPKEHKKLYLLAHSMGGAIATLATAELGPIWNAVVLNAPMFGINTGSYSHFMAKQLSAFMVDIGLGHTLADGQNHYDPNSKFEGNDLTHSKARFDMNIELMKQFPQTILGGACYTWVSEGLNATDEIQDRAHEIQSPILLFQAGDEKVVTNEGENEFCSHAPHCTLVPFAGANHEILMERDEIRDLALQKMFSYFESR